MLSKSVSDPQRTRVILDAVCIQLPRLAGAGQLCKAMVAALENCVDLIENAPDGGSAHSDAVLGAAAIVGTFRRMPSHCDIAGRCVHHVTYFDVDNHARVVRNPLLHLNTKTHQNDDFSHDVYPLPHSICPHSPNLYTRFSLNTMQRPHRPTCAHRSCCRRSTGAAVIKCVAYGRFDRGRTCGSIGKFVVRVPGGDKRCWRR